MSKPNYFILKPPAAYSKVKLKRKEDPESFLLLLHVDFSLPTSSSRTGGAKPIHYHPGLAPGSGLVEDESKLRKDEKEERPQTPQARWPTMAEERMTVADRKSVV